MLAAGDARNGRLETNNPSLYPATEFKEKLFVAQTNNFAFQQPDQMKGKLFVPHTPERAARRPAPRPSAQNWHALAMNLARTNQTQPLKSWF